MLFIDFNLAWNIILALEGHDLLDHQLLVLLDSVIDYALEDLNIAFTASEGNLWFNKLDETLNKKLPHESLVLVRVLSEALNHCELGIVLKRLDHFVNFLHLGDAHLVLLSTLCYLHVDLGDVKIVLVLLIELLLFGLDGFLQPDGVITTSLAVNVFDFLLSVHLDEGYHRVQDLCTLR